QGEGPSRKASVRVMLPDGFDPALQDLFDEDEVEDAAAETRTRLRRVEALGRSGKLPRQEGGGEFRLVREEGAWRIRVGWDDAVIVRFEGAVKMDLPWDFYPVRKSVRALPGETLQVLYKVKNRSDREITAKATHIIKPENFGEFLNIIQCFCFIQTTLEPGEEQELPLTFRVDWNAPSDLKEMTVRYEWYPIEHFRKKWEKRP
ncbi:MAG: cytochrome c oxidase assembly protein, partial [Nitrospinota bacterium]